MGLFDDVGPVQEELTIENMPLVDLFKKAIQDMTAFERNPNTATYEEMEKVLNKVVDRFGEVPAQAQRMVAGVPSTITGTLPSLKQMLALGPAAASVIPTLTGSMKTSINFAIAQL